MASLIGSLQSAANNIVRSNVSSSGMSRTQNSYASFVRFMESEVDSLKGIQFDRKKLNKAYSANVSTTFGNTGNLLGGLLNGALDIGGFLSNFAGRGKNAKPSPPKIGAGKVRLPGVRGLAILTPLLAGLDFAQGISEGESAGQAAAGATGSAIGAAGGALAGTALAGMLGQALVPVPGLGFVLGAAVGSLGGFAGGYAADRAYEAVTGKGGKEGIQQRLKEQEIKQKVQAASLSQLTFPQVMDKFETVVSKFETFAVSGGITTYAETEEEMAEAAQEQVIEDEAGQDPMGPDIALSGEGTFIQGSTGRSTGPHFHIGPEENYGKPEGLRDAQEGALKVSKALLAKKIPFLLSNLKQWVRPSQKLSDSELLDLIKQEQRAHMNRSMGSSYGGIDIAAPYGTVLPYPVEDVKDRGDGFGISGKLVGTKAFVAHGAKGSKSTPRDKIQQKPAAPGPEGNVPTIVLAAGTNTFNDPAKASADMKKSIQELKKKGYNVVVVPPSEQGAYANVSKAVQQAAASEGASIEKGKYDPNDPTRAYTHLDPNEAKRIREKYKGATFMGDSNAVRIAGGSDVAGLRVTGAQTDTISGFAANMKSVSRPPTQPQVQAVPQQPVTPSQVQQYPTYNQPQSSMTIVPIQQAMPGQQQQPMVISGGGGGGQTVVMPGPTESQVLNSLFKTMLLTNLSST